MTRSPSRNQYLAVFTVARQQLDAARAGDLDLAARLLEDRHVLLGQAPPPGEADRPLIQAILDLDHQVAGFFRQRMLAIREELLGLGQGRSALNGYRSALGNAFQRLDAHS
jgi:hypothetical protein